VIGLVLVSHSAAVARGAADLAAQMGGAELRIAVAGGLAGQPTEALGTDATLVAAAIDEVWSEDGVLVLMDLGSAVLSAEFALDLLADERRARVRLTPAPLIEGAVAAAVAAAQGASLNEAAAEAAAGLAGKVAQLAPDAAAAPTGDAGAPGPTIGPESPVPEQTLLLVITDPLGLHARPAARLVGTAAGFDAAVTVADLTAGRGPVSARSMTAVATLGARAGHRLKVTASGPHAAAALDAVRLAAGGFAEPLAAAEPPAAPAASAPPAAVTPPLRGAVLAGIAVFPGICVGPARYQASAAPSLAGGAPTVVADPAAAWDALHEALAATAGEIRATREAVATRAGDAAAAIFDAHLLLLDDEGLIGPARRLIADAGLSPAAAWEQVVAEAAARWEALDDLYLRSRAADLRAVAAQVLTHLADAPRSAPLEAGIVVAPDLTPAQTAALDPAVTSGVAWAFGGPTSHSAILARSLGLPTVAGLGNALLAVPPGTTLLLDGDAGTVTVDPAADVVAAAQARRAERARAENEAAARAHEPAVTRDGVTIRVAANIASPADVPGAIAAGADGVGLLRTEFLFLDSITAPTEPEQETAYRDVVTALAGRQLTIRTLDAGADKPLAFLPHTAELNPFLGLRGLRLGLRHPELLRTQLRAVLRIAASHPVRLMFPMVTTVDEIIAARELLDEEMGALAAAGLAARRDLEVGIMIEVPAAALVADALAPHVDFFSVGTNDLAQYTLATERGNPAVAALADPLHPAVLRLIERTARAAAAAGKRCAVCGELAGDPFAGPLLLGLGIDELSVTPARVALVKQMVRLTDAAKARDLAKAALTAASAADVRRLCAGG
jgi:multiphosphoryl transfer protein